MNLQKYTKAELISKFKKLDAKNSNINFSSKIVELFYRIKRLLIALVISGFIMKYFKKYTFFTKFLRFINWIIITIFGFSIFYNFNVLSFIFEFRNIITAIATYITTTSFYSYVASFSWFRTNEEPKIFKRTISSPTIYSKSEWNESKINQSERDSKILKWLKNKEEIENNNSDNTKYYILLLLLLLSCIAWYYYNGDITPPGIGIFWSWVNGIKNTINELKSTSTSFKNARDTAHEIFTDAKEFLRKKGINTFEAESEDILRDIQKWTGLVHLNENPKTHWNSYKVLETRIKQLSEKFPDEFNNLMNDRTSPAYAMINNFWNIGPTILKRYERFYTNLENETLIQQRAWSDPSSPMSQGMGELSIDMVNNSTIQRSDSQTTIVPSAPPAPPLPDVTDVPEIPATHKGLFEGGLENLRGKLKKATTIVKDKTPTGKVLGETEDIEPVASSSNIKLEDDSLTGKLSSGLNKMRSAIMPDDDIDPTQNYWDDETPSLNLTNKGKEKEILTHFDIENSIEGKNKINEIINKTKHLDSDDVIKEIKKEFPNYDENSYRDAFMKATEEEINSFKTQKEKDKAKDEILQADLLELQRTGSSSDSRTIKNAIRENYTHGSLLSEIKAKTSKDDLPPSIESSDQIENNTKLDEIIEKGKSLQTIEDLTKNDKIELRQIALKTNPDIIINKLKTLPDYSKNSFSEDLILDCVDNNMKKIINENPNLSRQEWVNLLISQNPKNKDMILDAISKTIDETFEDWKKLSTEEFKHRENIIKKADLTERESLSENRTVDQIKILRHVNKSHSNLLEEIQKKKGSNS